MDAAKDNIKRKKAEYLNFMYVKTLKIGSDKTLGTNSTVESDLNSLENMINNNRE